MLFIESTKPEESKVKIYNDLGEQIYKQQIAGMQNTVDLNYLPTGIYIVYVANGKTTIAQKIAIMH